jgi:hypothetical protein
MLQDLTHASFEAHLGTTFRIQAQEPPLQIALSEVRLLEPHPGPRRQPFSVYFRGPRQPILPQAIYALEHEAMGTLEIFIVPIGPDPKDGAMRYEAVFN